MDLCLHEVKVSGHSDAESSCGASTRSVARYAPYGPSAWANVFWYCSLRQLGATANDGKQQVSNKVFS